MSTVFDWSYKKLLEEASAGTPTPGGGSIAAIAACLGSSMVSMVANLTIGKEKYIAYEEAAIEVQKDASDITRDLERLVEADIAVFNQFMDALKLPKETDDQKATRKVAMEAAGIAATKVPMEIAEKILCILKIARKIAEYGNKSAISDVGVGASLAYASLESVILSVDINLPGIKDMTFVEKISTRQAELMIEGLTLKEETMKIVRGRL